MRNKLKKTAWPVAFAIPIFLIITGVLLVLWTTFLGWQQDMLLHREVAAFREQQAVATLPPQASSTIPIVTSPEITQPATDPVVFPELLAMMEAYNQTIYENGQAALVDKQAYQQEVIDLTDYGISENIAGVISIPEIDVEMPIYLGATDENMAKGFAQLGQTSMPIGGVNTNCVVAGHRGWRGAAYMRDVHLLDVGDMVCLENLWQTLEYQIVEIVEINPNDIDHILIQPGRDLLTIITCTSHDSGNHRILVICERVK